MQRVQQNAFANKWLSWIGPWQYQAFAGQLDDYDAVHDAKLIGLRVTTQPLPYLELGASRAIQWEGKDDLKASAHFGMILSVIKTMVAQVNLIHQIKLPVLMRA